MGLITFIKKIFNKNNDKPSKEEIKYNKFVNEIIPSLQLGDIIYAERFDFEEEKENMPKGHEVGPYVVVGFDEDKIIGVYCTSKNDKDNIIKVGEDYELMQKETYVDCKQIKAIDAYAYLKTKSNPLANRDKERIMKKLNSYKTLEYTYFGLTKSIDFSFDVKYYPADIILYRNKEHLILERKINNDLIVVPLKYHDGRYQYINFAAVSVDYLKAKTIKEESITYINTINHTDWLRVFNVYKSMVKEVYKNNKRNPNRNSEKIVGNLQPVNKDLKRGHIITYDGWLYYVYGIEGNMANTFAIFPSQDQTGITINNTIYTPKYNILKDIDIKKDKYAIMGMASDEEIEKVKENKKNTKMFIKTIKADKVTKSKKVFKKGFDINSIVCLKNDITSRYIIREDNDDTYHVISLNTLLLKDMILEYDLDKELFKLDENITDIERNIINRKLNALEQPKKQLQKK